MRRIGCGAPYRECHIRRDLGTIFEHQYNTLKEAVMFAKMDVGRGCPAWIEHAGEEATLDTPHMAG